MRSPFQPSPKLSATLACASAAALAAALSSAAPAYAQDEPAESEAGDAAQEQEIVVTGSRIARSTFNTPNPVTVFGEEDIERLALSSVNDVLTQLPQNNNSISTANLQSGSFNNGVQVANLRGLNPFFGTRTLTLMNGQRVVPTTAGGGLDLTLIPSMAVGRVETVTGGASAIYGSDAVAGVVNIILDTSLEGFKGQIDFSRTKYGDGNVYHGSAAYGTDFDGGRGHFLVGGEVQHAEEVGSCSLVRDWCAENNFLFTNLGYNTPGAPGYGQPRYIIGPDARPANVSFTGVLIPVAPSGIPGRWSAPVGQMQFDESGAGLVPYTAGALLTPGFSSGTQQGGDPNSGNIYDGRTLRPDVRKYTAIARLDYDVSDSVTASLDGWYGRTVALNPVTFGATGRGPNQVSNFPNLYQLNTPVTSYNPFLTPAQQAYVNSAGSGLALFGRNILNEYTSPHRTETDTWRISGTLTGDLGAGWAWDAYAAYGKTVTEERVYNDTITPLLGYALDAVRNGSGQIVCGVTIPGQVNPVTGAPYTAGDVVLASLNGGCQPLNLFGVGNASEAALNYINQTLFEDIELDQTVVAANIRGDLFEGWAGPIKLAAGAEYRHDFVDVTHNLENQPWYKLYTLTYGLDFRGSTEVIEGYAELNVPVIRDVPFFHYVEFDGAIRQTHNKASNKTREYPAAFASDMPVQAGESRSRDFLTWKISGIWDVTDWLRFRATRSRDARAAQARELFQVYAQSVGPFATVNNPWHGGALEPAPRIAGGSLDVKPERSDTLTAGLILQPRGGFLDRFRFSVDWYQIEISDPIVGPPVGLGGQNIVNGCFAGQVFFCTLVTRDAADNILLINDGSVNLGKFTNRGVDIEVGYTLPLDNGSAGVLSFRGLASYLYDMRVDTGRGGPIIDYAGQSGPYGSLNINPGPYWQGNAFVTYAKGPFSGTLQVRYVGPGRYLTVSPGGGTPVSPGDDGYASTDPNSVNDNTVSSAFYVNVSGSYDITESVTLFGSINNLLNKEPPVAPSGTTNPGTNPVHFDVYGMTWKVGARARF